ncbi:hypothetical protein WJX72_006279 [[Myrmecia] bisecta]|uniref:F-box domain-containing protein n=1 Tax=[Myrmecia] bisecta TaxID=41462 RepID=A0AAW1P0U3_9CHLO
MDVSEGVGALDLGEKGGWSPLLNLPACVLEHILGLLDVRDIASCGETCKELRLAAASDGLWRGICRVQWSSHTQLADWIIGRSLGCFVLREHEALAPRNYRSLYRLLSKYEQLIGIWRGEPPGRPDMPAGNALRESLYEFRWQHDCIEGSQLIFDDIASCKRVPFQRIHALGLAAAEIVDNMHCLLKLYDASSMAGRQLSHAAEAAAAVAMSHFHPGSPAATSPLGTSPEGSFEYEMLRFMQGNVASNRSRRKRSLRSPSQGRLGIPVVHHLTRVERPLPSKKHPLAGLWKGDYGVHGVQVVVVVYDFSGPAARILATKVTGDGNVPAGMQTFFAKAAPIAEPWSPKEQALIQLRTVFLADVQQQNQPGSGVHQANAKQVVACFKGKGKVVSVVQGGDKDTKL